MPNLRPRLCVMEKGANGYGFHLHGEKTKSGQFVRLVESDTAASVSGLLAGDRLLFVNGDSVEGESHQHVVSKIRATVGCLELIVVDADTAALLEKHNLKCQKEFVTEGIPVPGDDSDSDRGDSHSNGSSRRGSSPVPRENGDASSDRLSVSSKEETVVLRPRLCHMRKASNGYGFNLHSDKNKGGQFIRAVDEDTPAERAGLRPKDKIIQVNGKSVVGMSHAEVVAAIRVGGDETSMLVVDEETDGFFQRCRVLPTEEHLTGPLPHPLVSSLSVEVEETVERVAKVSVSSSSSSSSSNAASSSPGEDKGAPELSPEAARLGLGMSVAEAKQRAHEKRAARKPPSMDWNKKNQVFSNL
ncbi:Na(+)/H(+) exchange regulatory cofactor NHE-RF1a [Nelusetta ayraudi]|uniref:Na(+)/H(+) exchange regulatory cofactor NHE-RF1a n=1 Tax=Nelusetta ayraudi TaxID=303726 RepID=UPI003F7034B0